MGALASIGAFGSGLTTGASQGADLYSKFQQIQDEGQARQRKQKLEQKVTELTQSGAFDDPIAGLRQVGDYARELGDVDTYLKYNETANGLQKTKADRLGMVAYQAAMGKDYDTAVQNVNEFMKTLNTGTQYELQRAPEGYRVISNTNGKRSEQILSDDEQLQGFFMAATEPYLFGDVGKYMEAQTNKAKGASEIAENQAQTNLYSEQSATEQARRPAEVNLLQAQTGQAGATAAAQAAAAKQTNAETAAMPEKNDLARRTAEADIAYKQGLTGNIGQGVDPDISVVVQRTAGPEPLPGDPVSPTADPIVRGGVASGIAEVNGVDPEVAVGQADTILNSPGVMLHPETNTAYLKDGTAIKLSPTAMAQVYQARKAAMGK